MFWLYTDTPEFYNDICEEIRLFVSAPEIVRLEAADARKGDMLAHFFWMENNMWRCKAEYRVDGVCARKVERSVAVPPGGDALRTKKLKKRFVKECVYEVCKQHFNKRMPWGSLTGIRPTKLLRDLACSEGEAGAVGMFREEFDVSASKTALAQAIVHNQDEVLRGIEPQEIDLYVGIPFCTSRCRYCSFISFDLKHDAALKSEYLKHLEREIVQTRDLLRGRRVRALYIGGGTPTALEEAELGRLVEALHAAFPNPLEYTVEAGRPDTVTPGKLHILKEAGVTRISINPQTTNDATLAAIGRNHSARDFREAFELARRAGFGQINTDVILGLPGEGMKDVEKTLTDLNGLRPENVTVHTLALKRSSAFAREQGQFAHTDEIAEMVEYAQSFLMEKGYLPYYLYRQKYMSGNLENVGFSLPGNLCLYNIDHMEEVMTILAYGAGAISKRVDYGAGRIERAANVKDVKSYIMRTEEMAERKRRLME